ncbi:MAG: hypothetical protein WCF99_10005 [Chloroflexales bacterium]
MIETWLFIVEIFKLIALFATFPAQMTWRLIATGTGFSAFLCVGIIISVYGGMITALIRGAVWLAVGRPPPRRRRQRWRCTSR